MDIKQTYAKKKFIKREKCKTVTPLFYTCFYGVKSVYNKKIRRFFRNRYKDIFALKKSLRGLKVKYFLKELREYAKVHEYD